MLYVSPLKALAVDVERNLRAPLAGIAQVADSSGDAYIAPAIAIRTGDTPQSERARFQREPADILITTPESLYLLLTSNAREALRSVHTIIVDEIHALVPTKRGAHLALSLERLEARCERPPQRIGLSATQRPLDEVARFLGGAVTIHNLQSTIKSAIRNPQSAIAAADAEIEQEFAAPRTVRYRPVTIVDAGQRKSLQLTIDVPVEDMAKLSRADAIPSGPAHLPQGSGGGQASSDARPSIWSAIHPRLLEIIRAHRSTLIFVNSRRLAERLAGALNELAGETLVRSHHGSIARPQRVEVEDLLKAGALRALVATSSLELGIDMGAIDMVVQIEAPPSVASGLQRIGRGGHRANAVSEGVIFPKFRGDLVACAAVAKAMHEGAVEATRYPRNPLDIVAQQVVAMASMDDWDVEELFAAIRGAAPFAELSRPVFDGVLDMLSGRYPVGRVRRAAPAHHVGPCGGNDQRARRRQTRGHRQRRHDSRSRSVRGVPDRRGSWRRARRRARRRDGVREPRRRNVRARRLVVAHRGDHARSRAGVARAWRTRQDAVLERRPRGPAAGTRARDRPAGARPAAIAASSRRRSPDDGNTTSIRAPPKTCSSIFATSWPRHARCPTRRRS